MIQICRKDKEKVYEAIRTGKIDADEMSFPNLIDDILLTMKRRGLTASLAQALALEEAITQTLVPVKKRFYITYMF